MLVRGRRLQEIASLSQREMQQVGERRGREGAVAGEEERGRGREKQVRKALKIRCTSLFLLFCW